MPETSDSELIDDTENDTGEDEVSVWCHAQIEKLQKWMQELEKKTTELVGTIKNLKEWLKSSIVTNN